MKRYVCMLLPVLAVCGCQDYDRADAGGFTDNGREMTLMCSISQEYLTRANDGGFADGDAIGVYVVDYHGDQAGELQAHGNHADNVKFAFDASTHAWKGSGKIYWNDNHTPIDAYSYYPYVREVAEVKALPFTVQHRQDRTPEGSTLTGYEASDFLWAKDVKVTPMTPIDLTHRHIMASVQLSLIEGEGFAPEEWAAAGKAVTVTNTRTEGTVDLTQGIAVVDSQAEQVSIVPYCSGNDWRCIVLPQAMAPGATLLEITVDGELYQFARPESVVYQPGKLHKFAIKVDKREKGDYQFTLVSEAITAWENDPVSHGAESRSYITVHVPSAGGLQEAVDKAGLKYDKVLNLKITGELTDDDFAFMVRELTYLEALNLKEAKTVNCTINEEKEDDVLPDYAFCNPEYEISGADPNKTRMIYLKYVVFPEKMKKIGKYAFRATSLTQDVILPQGLTYIGEHAFDNSRQNDCNSYGSDGIWYTMNLSKIVIPSSVTYIGDYAFAGCTMKQELVLPEKLEYLGECAFEDCQGISGSIYLPDNITDVGRNTFYGNTNLSGNLALPNSIVSVQRGAFARTGLKKLTLNEGLRKIGQAAFSGMTLWSNNDVNLQDIPEACPFAGELVIPSTVTLVERYAFANSGFEHIYFKNNLEELPEGIFFHCKELCDTLRVPTGIMHIGSYAFADCQKLTAVVLPKTLLSIEEHCFENCFSLDYIECLSETPPELMGGGHFDGVAKDNFTLVVPKGCVDAYRNAPGWNEFKRISEYRNFVCRPQAARLLNRGNTRNIVLNSEGKWSVTHRPAWMHISKTSGELKTELQVTIDAQPHGAGYRCDSIVFALEGSDITTCYKVEQYDSEREEDAAFTLQTASKGKGIDLVFIGDGYDAKDISEDTYLDDMKQSMEYFFDVEPYKTYRDYFNVYTAFAMSYESGIGTVNTLRDAKFGTFVGDCKVRMSCDFDKAFYYCVDNTPADEKNADYLTCIVTANTTVYDGVTAMFPGSYGNGAAVALCPKSDSPYPYDARGLVQHEAGGHAFGKLADEYIYHAAWIQTCKCTDGCKHVAGLENDHNQGWGHNLSFTGRYGEVEWNHLINDNRFNDLADIYEGGYFHSRGVFRSERNSCMNNNVPYYSTWSRELIVRRIKVLAGEKFDYEEFATNDSREWGRDFTLQSRVGKADETRATAPVRNEGPIRMKRRPQRNKQ